VSQFAGKRIVREPVEIEKGEPLRNELAAFIECARAGAQPKVSGREATAALELALEITRRIEESAEFQQRSTGGAAGWAGVE
jgi:predicted dehydrogenase